MTRSTAPPTSTTKWTEVWSHIYLGRIYDIQGDRTRAVNEYSKAKQTGDDTGGAQAEAEKSLKKAYTETERVLVEQASACLLLISSRSTTR